MPFYHHLGELPHKRHTQFRQPNGALYHEQVMGTRGFEGIQSIVYHRRAPTTILQAEDRGPIEIGLEQPGALRHRHFRTRRLAPGGDSVMLRRRRRFPPRGGRGSTDDRSGMAGVSRRQRDAPVPVGSSE